MMYPFMTLDDNTEVVHSEMLPDGRVKVYFEKPDAKDCFHSAVCYLPDYKWEDINGFTPEEIAIAETATAATESIQQQTGEEGFCLENILTDTESEERMVEKIALRQAVEKLPERERMVIQLRYYHCLTQQRVARVMEVSQVQVSRIEKKALEKIREFMQ